jgi:hypothetical protein
MTYRPGVYVVRKFVAKGMFLSVGCDVFGFQGRSRNFEKRLLASSCLSIRLSAWNSSACIGRILMKLDI